MTFFLFLMTLSFASTPVELQWSLCEPSANSFFDKTKVSSANESKRQVYYLETSKMDLYSQDSFVRTRIEGAKIKRAVKVKYPEIDSIPGALVEELGLECEKDSYPGQYKWVCSLKSKPAAQDEELSESEEIYLSSEAHFENFAALRNWGPVASSEWTFALKSRELTLETLRGPEGYFSMELSARVKDTEEKSAFQEIQSWVQRHKLLLCPVQQGKTGELLKVLIRTRSHTHRGL